MQPYYAFKELEILLDIEKSAMLNDKEMREKSVSRVDTLREFMDSLADDSTSGKDTRCNSVVQVEKKVNTEAELTAKMAESLMQENPMLMALPKTVAAPVEVPSTVDEALAYVPHTVAAPEHVEQPAISPFSIPKAPIAAVVVAPAPEGTIDSKGLPWDERLHLEGRTFNKDGSWRSKRRLDENFIIQVETELRAKMRALKGLAPVTSYGSPAAALSYPAPPPPTIHVEIPNFAANSVPFKPVEVAPPVQTYENVVVPQGVRPAHSLLSFQNNLMTLLSQLVSDGKINREYIEELKKYFNVKEIWHITSSGKQSMELYDVFAQAGFITKVD